MSDTMLDTILRFHIILDGRGVIRHLGPSVRSLLPSAEGRSIADLVAHATGGIDIEAAPSEDWMQRLVHLRFAQPDFTLRGEFHRHDAGGWLFAGALDPTDAHRVNDLGLAPSDFAASDLTMDFSMLKWTRDSQIRETRLALLQLRRSISEGQELREQVDTDPLTGIANRNRFLSVVNDAMTGLEPGDFAVLMIDIDRFKAINDLNGHQVGDEALIHVARHLAWAAGDNGLVARLGGDEFAVLVTRPTNGIGDLRLVVDQLCADVVALNNAPVSLREHRIAIRLTVGVAFHKDEEVAGDLLRHADVAMYAARAADNGPVGVFDPLAQHELELRRSLAEELEDAIENNAIQLQFQPIVDLRTRRVVKFEVLSRWRHPRHGSVPPDLFFDVAEQCHLIKELDRYVIARALDVARTRLASPGSDVPVLSVNVSALSLTDDLVDYIRDTLHELHYPANRLCVEVTETSSITDMPRTNRVLHDLDALGIVVSLDDFGTGFSSLTYLHQLPIGALKIDRSFVADMLTSRKALELVRSILNVARSLDLPVVAEGIETIEQCVMLQNLGCDQGQGYYFARPASAEAAYETMGRMLPFGSSEVDPTRVVTPAPPTFDESPTISL